MSTLDRTLDDRLRELAQVTHAQLDPSPDLYRRIERATARRPARRPITAAPIFVTAAGLAAAVALVFAIHAPHRHAAPTHVVGTSQMTRQAFIAQLDEQCQAAASQKPAQVVFPTAQGYAAAAAASIPTIERYIISSQQQATDIPPDAGYLESRLIDDLQLGLEQLKLAQTRGNAGDTTGAQTAYNQAQTDFADTGTALAGYGATACANGS